ncbi:ExbD/TolR family protein [Congregicoccus parvus]|uniref:ExbD/TolR family protein n=1 Tax=Congregicoccus parvus TaxID=3081749 RepID=UPI003FA56D39
MAPMIDMVFLLLVFFMCVSSLAQAEKLVPVTLPESTESKVPEDLSQRMTITVLPGGEVHAGAVAVGASGIEEVVRRAATARPGLRVHVRAAQDVPFGEIKTVLQACARGGAVEVIYATHQVD